MAIGSIKLLMLMVKVVPRGGIEPPTRGFSMEAAQVKHLLSMAYVAIFLVCLRVCFWCHYKGRAETLC